MGTKSAWRGKQQKEESGRSRKTPDYREYTTELFFRRMSH
jgi:hypothetical protein